MIKLATVDIPLSQALSVNNLRGLLALMHEVYATACPDDVEPISDGGMCLQAMTFGPRPSMRASGSRRRTAAVAGFLTLLVATKDHAEALKAIAEAITAVIKLVDGSEDEEKRQAELSKRTDEKARHEAAYNQCLQKAFNMCSALRDAQAIQQGHGPPASEKPHPRDLECALQALGALDDLMHQRADAGNAQRPFVGISGSQILEIDSALAERGVPQSALPGVLEYLSDRPVEPEPRPKPVPKALAAPAYGGSDELAEAYGGFDERVEAPDPISQSRSRAAHSSSDMRGVLIARDSRLEPIAKVLKKDTRAFVDELTRSVRSAQRPK